MGLNYEKLRTEFTEVLHEETKEALQEWFENDKKLVEMESKEDWVDTNEVALNLEDMERNLDEVPDKEIKESLLENWIRSKRKKELTTIEIDLNEMDKCKLMKFIAFLYMFDLNEQADKAERFYRLKFQV